MSGSNKIQDRGTWSVQSSVMTSRTVDVGQLLALSCHRKRAKSRKLKALMTGPSGIDHKLSQLATERLVLNFDPACCTFILQRDLILFIKPGETYSLLSTAYNYTSIRGRARPQMVQLQFHFSVLTFRKKREREEE